MTIHATIHEFASGHASTLPEDLTKKEVGELLSLYHETLAEKDAINALERVANQDKARLQKELQTRLTQSGLEKISGGGLTVWMDEQATVKIDEQRWDDIVSALVDGGQLHLIQRRITASRVEELVLDGFPLPEGLSLESFPVLKHRRSG